MTVPTELDARFRQAATEKGLLDVAYDLVDSPLGELLVGVTACGLCAVSFAGEGGLDEVATRFGARVLLSSRPVAEVRQQLGEYFDGQRHDFDLDVDLRPVTPFGHAVLRELARVPYGRTATYGELAARIGRPKAARAVGSALNRNPVPIVLPCHRIVGATGQLVGYAGGLERKEQLLRLERRGAGD